MESKSLFFFVAQLATLSIYRSFLWDLIISVLSRTDAEKSTGNLTFNIFFCLSSQFCSSTVGCVTRVLVHSLSLSLLLSPFFLLSNHPNSQQILSKNMKTYQYIQTPSNIIKTIDHSGSLSKWYMENLKIHNLNLTCFLASRLGHSLLRRQEGARSDYYICKGQTWPGAPVIWSWKEDVFFVFLKYPARNFNIYQEWAIFFEPVSSPLPKHDCMVSMFSFWGCILKGFTKRAGQVWRTWHLQQLVLCLLKGCQAAKHPKWMYYRHIYLHFTK